MDPTPQGNVLPILVTGAAGSVGAVGRSVVEGLRRRGLPVWAMVRRDDERAEALRATGAEVVVGDLTRAGDVADALAGCGRMYFGMGVSVQYLEAAVTTAAVARAYGRLEAFANMSRLTVSEMDLTSTSESVQQRQQ
jgi:nucleoside-diphosphate-sugar epimerase